MRRAKGKKHFDRVAALADPTGELDPASFHVELGNSAFDDIRWGVRKPTKDELVQKRMKELVSAVP